MSEVNDKELEGLEIQFDDEQPQGAEGGQGAEQTQQPPTPPAPQAQTQQTQQVFGPNVLSVTQKYQEAQKQYEELIQRKKQLKESGYDVPVELDAAIAREAARLASLEAALEQARRMDAMVAVGPIVSRLLSELSPQVAKRVEGEFRSAVEQAVQMNPDVVHNEQALRVVLNAIVGQVITKYLSQQRVAPSAPGVPTPPPRSKPTNVEPPEMAKRLGVSESAWRRVAELPDEGWTDIDL